MTRASFVQGVALRRGATPLVPLDRAAHSRLRRCSHTPKVRRADFWFKFPTGLATESPHRD